MRLASLAGLLLAAFAACGESLGTDGSRGPDARGVAWMECLRPSQLPGVERETIPGLEREVEGVRVVTGSLGQRGADEALDDDTFRLAAVGGGLTFGVGLAAAEAWPQALAAQLDRSLLSNGKRVVALNLGTPFASATDRLGLAARRAVSWRPWLLVVELDAAQLAGATLADLERPMRDLRDAAAGIECGVLVVVGQPLDTLRAGTTVFDAERQLLVRAAERAGLAALDLLEVHRARPIAGAPLGQTAVHRLPHATAEAQRWVLEAVKQRLFHTGLLGNALSGR